MKKLLTSLPPLLCIVALLLCMGCWKEKEQKTTVDFRIVEYGTNQPIENARIILKQCESEFLGGTFCIELDTVFTDAQGRFKLDLSETPLALELGISAENYFAFDGDYSLLWNRHNTGDIALYPHAWLKVHIKNVNPFDVFDKLELGWVGGSNPIYGSDVDSILIYKLLGNRELSLSWASTKNNQIYFYKDSLYLPGHDTTFYEILY
ncbi:MAG: hypothetical protein KA101_00005 [Saprospiraceae bacterium]|nr:hypothetical protein [Saprospiraceae bacterium]